MKETPRDLNLLRDALLARKAKGEQTEIKDLEIVDPVNTLERFEALPIEEQMARMQAKDYTDLELFKQKHFGKGKEVTVDINTLRAQVEAEQKAMSPELMGAEVKFLQAGLPCEVISRGAGLEPYLKIALPTGDVYVAHYYGHIVSTDRIPGFNTSTAGLGEFEYYVQV